MPTTTAAPLADVIAAARPIVERVVWCTVATAGASGPRTRLMHPVWWWDADGPSALVSARPTPVKVRELDESPWVSCFYWDPAHDTVAIDACAEWVPAADIAGAWTRIAAVAAPVGFDPAIIWPDGPDSADCGFLRLTAHRVVATRAGRPGLRWRG